MNRFVLSACMLCAAATLNAQDYVESPLSTAPVDSVAEMREEINQLKNDYAEMKANEEKLRQQVETSKIWKKNKFFRVGYAATSSKFKGFKQDNKGGVFFSFGNTFLFPSNPIANCLKIGFDVLWADLTYGTLKNNGYSYGGMDVDLDDDIPIGSMDPEEYIKLKPTFLNISVGIGPNVTVTPFFMMDNALRELKIKLYGHYRPGAGGYIVSDEGDLEASWAYTGWWDFGGNINWKMIGVGVEGSWGSGNFKSLMDDLGDLDEAINVGAERSGKRSFSSCRVYLQVNF